MQDSNTSVPSPATVAPPKMVTPPPLDQDWVEIIAQADIRGPGDPGVSFVHLQCDCSSLRSTRNAMDALLHHIDQIKLGTKPVLVLPDTSSVDELDESLPGFRLFAYDTFLALFEYPTAEPLSVVVFDDHGGRHSFLSLMAMAWLIRTLAERCRSDPAQAYATVFVLSPSKQCLWAGPALVHHIPESLFRCSTLQAHFQTRPDPQPAPPSHDDPVPDLYTVMDGVVTCLADSIGTVELEPHEVLFASCMLPLEVCVQLRSHLLRNPDQHSNVQIAVLAKYDSRPRWQQIIGLCHNRGSALLLLVDSSLRFLPVISAPPFMAVLPREVMVRQWDQDVGHVVQLTARVPVAEFHRLHALNSTKKPDQVESYWAGQETIRLKNTDCFPWSGDILELVLCAIGGLQHGPPGAPETMWWCLRDIPIYPFDVQRFRACRHWFEESLSHLRKWGLVTTPGPDPCKGRNLGLDDPGHKLTGNWGSPVFKLLMTHGAVNINEAILIVALRREKDNLVRYTLAAIASLCRLGIQTIIQPGSSVVQPTFDSCRAHCTGIGAALASRGRFWLALGLLHRAKTAEETDRLRLVEDNIDIMYPQFASFDGLMKLFLDEPEPDSGNLSGALTQQQLLRVEVALFRAMLPNSLMYACQDPVTPTTLVGGLQVNPEPLGWADDQSLPSSLGLGVHFGLQKKCRAPENDDKAAIEGYTSTIIVEVSSDAALKVFDEVFPSERYGGRRPNFFALMESWYRANR